MNRRNKRRLESAGWKVGTTAEFFGLGDEDAAMAELRLGLADGVREERKRHSMTQAQLGRLLGSSQSRVVKMEATDPSVSVDLIIRSLLTMAASRNKVASSIATPARKRAA